MALMKFTRRTRGVEVDPTTLMIASLLDIWNNDQSDIKGQANKYLAFVHLMSQLDFEAPFFNASEEELTPLCKNEIFRNPDFMFEEADKILVDNAILMYQKANEIPEERLYHDYIRKIDEIRNKIANTPVEIVRNVNSLSGAVTFASNGKIISDLMKELDNMVAIKDEMYNKLRNARVTDKKVKGQRNPSFLEKKHMEGQYGNIPGQQSNSGAAEASGEADIRGQEQSEVRADGSESAETQAASKGTGKARKRINQRKRETPLLTAGKNEEF